MARIIFDNPNVPEQPTKGVYRWFYRSGGEEITIYVGCAGNRIKTVGNPSTLKRGIQEAQRSCVTSDKGKVLDTDFIVGTALQYLKQQDYDCIWQHVSDEPKDEAAFCKQFRPLVQSLGTTIDRHLRLAKPDAQLWSGADIVLAETLLLEVLRERLPRARGA